MSDVDPTPDTPVTIGDRIAWFRGDMATFGANIAELLELMRGQPFSYIELGNLAYIAAMMKELYGATVTVNDTLGTVDSSINTQLTTINDNISAAKDEIIGKLDTLIDATQYSTQVLLQIKDPVNQPPASFDWTTAVRAGNWNNIGTFNLGEGVYQAYMPVVQSPIGSGTTQIYKIPHAPPNLAAWIGSTFQGEQTKVHIGWNFTDWKVVPKIMLFNHDLTDDQYGLFLKDNPQWYEVQTYPNMVSDVILDTFYTYQPVTRPLNIIASIMLLFPVGYAGKPPHDIWFDEAH